MAKEAKKKTTKTADKKETKKVVKKTEKPTAKNSVKTTSKKTVNTPAKKDTKPTAKKTNSKQKDNKNKEQEIKKIIRKLRTNTFLNVIIFILITSFFVVGILVGSEYGRRQMNENDVKDSIEEIEKELENKEGYENTKPIEATYKGYKVVGIIEIPKISIKYPIIDESREETMKYSITRFKGKGANEIGNLTLAGHNNKDGTMFGDIKYLNEGDTLYITDLTGRKLEYEIFKKYTIDPNDISCVESVEEGTREVTLITCTNGHVNRLIFKARELRK